jgi:biotin carboxylase
MHDTRGDKIGGATILIFGAGINQLELIRSARDLGVRSVVIDPSPDPPGKPLADHFYRIDGNDYPSTRDIALKHKVDGIVTGQMENPLRLMARLAEELNLRFHRPDTIEQCVDKWLMKRAFMRGHVPCAYGVLLKSGDAPEATIMDSIQFPAIIKPRDSFSSRGVFKISSLAELKQRLQETETFSSTGDVIVEEFLDGREFSIETITWRGNTKVIQYTEKFITPYPYAVEMAHLQPAGLSTEEKSALEGIAVEGIRSLGINNSAAHAEIMLTESGPKIVEIGARLGGDFISSYLTRSSTGISMDQAAVNVAVGRKPDLVPKYQKYSMIRYLELPVGKTIQRILPMEGLLGSPHVVFAFIFIKPGETVPEISHSAKRPACVIVEAENRRDVIQRTDWAISQINEKIILN